MSPRRKRFHCFGQTGNKGLNAAVAAVADPTAQSQRPGFSTECPAKADALDAAVDRKMAG